VAGTLRPILHDYGVTFRNCKGFNSATKMHEMAVDTQILSREARSGRVYAYYLGDWDPSGLYMSNMDLPQRLRELGASVNFLRLAVTGEDIHAGGLTAFDPETKKTDSRYQWFRRHFDTQCYELDAMDPRTLRERVGAAIRQHIDRAAWERSAVAERAEHASMEAFLHTWNGNANRG
jgi:hypothetical protein